MRQQTSSLFYKATRNFPLTLHINRFYGNAQRCGAPIVAFSKHPEMANRSIAMDVGSLTSPEMVP